MFEKNININNFRLNFQFYTDNKINKTDYFLINKEIDNFFSNNQYNFSLEEIICYFRTLLKNYDEFLLKITINTDKENIYVEYLNKQLVIFNKTIKTNHENLFIQYTNKNGLKIDYPTNLLELDKKECTKFYKLIFEELNNIIILSNIKTAQLDESNKILIHI